MKISAHSKILLKTNIHNVDLVPGSNIPVAEETGQIEGISIVYDLAPDTFALVSTPGSTGARWSAVQSLRVREDCPVARVSTQRGRVVEIATDALMAVFDPVSGGLKKVPLSVAVGQLIAVVRQLPEFPAMAHVRTDISWLIGAFVSDGWVNDNCLGFTKADDAIRDRFADVWSKWCGEVKQIREYIAEHEAASNNGVGGKSAKIHIDFAAFRLGKERATWLKNHCYHPDIAEAVGKRAALYKQLPPGFLGYTREARLGILAGLIDGDGSVSICRGKSKPQVCVTIATSSEYLRNDIGKLLISLGIKFSVSETHPKEGRLQSHVSYTVSVSTPDFQKILPELQIETPYPGVEMLRNAVALEDQRDLIPLTLRACQDFLDIIPMNPENEACLNSLTTLRSRARNSNYPVTSMRVNLEKYLTKIPAGRMTPELVRLKTMVHDWSITWDVVKSVEPCGRCRAYDLVIPASRVYAVGSGLII